MNLLHRKVRPGARIIGHTAFQVILKKLNQLLHDQSISDHHYKLLKIIYILAYRTGMRINEILGLHVKDIEGLNQFSILGSTLWFKKTRESTSAQNG